MNESLSAEGERDSTDNEYNRERERDYAKEQESEEWLEN